MNRNTDVLYSEADYMLSAANIEMQRAQEDVVAHKVCYQSRQSITNYFRGFLISRGIEPNQPLSMENLYQQCVEIDPRFKLLDLSPMPCKTEEGHASYCLSIEKVRECLGIAEKTRELVREVPA
ncbi:MAG: hypothetical protein OEM26_01100 [Saprospiraceae bacterium]|nr:hypothetical protein [Saprospiraceae bacterium]